MSNTNYNSDLLKKGGQNYLKKSLVNFPCTFCERNDHVRCVEEILRKRKSIHGTSAHCIWYFNEHRNDPGCESD